MFGFYGQYVLQNIVSIHFLAVAVFEEKLRRLHIEDTLAPGDFLQHYVTAGKRQENVHDVVRSGDRKPGADGKLPKVGNTVDLANATWTNTIGASELITVWTDPEFDPKVSAAYYARVLEIPTPRWTAYEAKRFRITMKEEIPMVTVERAYTSPIWYTP